MREKYKIIHNGDLDIISTHGIVTKLETQTVLEAVNYTHDIFDKFTDFGVDVFSILGMRNLSAFVGEVFAKSVEIKASGLFKSNPHQDGYPDLLLMDAKGLSDWKALASKLKDKSPFSPFPNGGIEVKATCGSVPTPAQCRKKGLEKPGMGDTRVNFLLGYDWKAHHRETNNLFGILWDFMEGVPRIVALFYSSDLTEDDWGKIVKPKEGGGRTTSVSIMTRGGIKKMYEGTILVIEDRGYSDFLNRYNSGDKL